MSESTYSGNLKIELIATGAKAGTWGTVTNTNLGTAIEEAITASINVDVTNDVVLTAANSNGPQVFRKLRLTLTGTPTTARSITVPASLQKLYIVSNTTTQDITIKYASGTTVTVPAGKSMVVYGTGTNFVEAVTHANTFSAGTITAVTLDLDDIEANTIDVGTIDANIANLTTITATTATVSNLTVTTAATFTDVTSTNVTTSRLLINTPAERVVTVANSATPTIDVTQGSFFDVTLDQNITSFTFTNLPSISGYYYGIVLRVLQTNPPKGITWNSNIRWPENSAPTLTQTNNRYDMFVLITTNGGSTWYGAVAGRNYV